MHITLVKVSYRASHRNGYTYAPSNPINSGSFLKFGPKYPSFNSTIR
jgi:hypothetical protein